MEPLLRRRRMLAEPLPHVDGLLDRQRQWSLKHARSGPFTSFACAATCLAIAVGVPLVSAEDLATTPSDASSTNPAVAAPAQPALARLDHTSHTILRKIAPSCVQIGDKIWYIEVWQRYQTFKRRRNERQLESFDLKHRPPMFYDFVSEESVPTLLAAIARSPGMVVLQGKVFQVTADGLLVSTEGQTVLITGYDTAVVDGSRISTVAEYVGVHQYVSVQGATRTVREFRAIQDSMNPVSEETLAAYFLEQSVQTYPIFVPRKVWIQRPKTKYSTSSGGTFKTKKRVGTTPGVYRYEWRHRRARIPMRLSEPNDSENVQSVPDADTTPDSEARSTRPVH